MATRQLQPLDPCTLYIVHSGLGFCTLYKIPIQNYVRTGWKKLEAELRIRNNSLHTDPVPYPTFLKSFGSGSKKPKKKTLRGILTIFIGIFNKFQCNFNTGIRIRVRSTDPYPDQATQIKTDISVRPFGSATLTGSDKKRCGIAGRQLIQYIRMGFL